ncbi:MAG: hypothetical protein WDO73_11510 [Ignavibacteriota bacterium]
MNAIVFTRELQQRSTRQLDYALLVHPCVSVSICGQYRFREMNAIVFTRELQQRSTRQLDYALLVHPCPSVAQYRFR